MAQRDFKWCWLALMSALVATGCGGGGSTQSTPAPSPSPSPSPSGPTATSASAAKQTATTNAQCTALGDFYWEIGDKTQALVSGSVGTSYSASTELAVASASKWIYASYVAERRSGQLDAQNDVPFLNFTSGYDNMGVGVGCPLLATTVNDCLAGSAGTRTAGDVGVFDYDAGHMENHAAQQMGLGALSTSELGAEISSKLGVSLTYSEPLLAGGARITSTQYATMLRGILSGSLKMHSLLGDNSVCATTSATCTSVKYSPTDGTGVNWRYSMGHWVEEDGSFNSAGAFGYYPWIDKTVTYYGIIARENRTSALTGEQEGLNSALCGAAIRKAWTSGTPQ